MTVHRGGCLCGAVRYRAHGPTSHPTLCHCSSCRRASGAPCVAWVTVPSAGFEFTAGSPVFYPSSPGVQRGFCATCGTTLSYARGDLPDEIDVTTCSLDDPDAHPPADHTWTSERLSWITLAGELPQHTRTRS